MVPRSVVVLAMLIALAGCAGLGGPLAPNDTATETSPSPHVPDDTTTGTTTVPASNGTLAVHYINVGQGSSALVVGPTGETMLIDSGDFTDDGEHVLSYLRNHGVERIDYLVTSHAHADHIGGHAAVIEYYETEADGIGAVYDPGVAASTRVYEEYLDAVERHDVTLYRTVAGDEIPMEGAAVDVLSPPEDYLADRDRNENSLVLRVTFGRSGFLFTGDAGDPAEDYLVDEHGGDLTTTVLTVGHHGSRGSTGDRLLDAADPAVAVISSAYDSEYGHPHDETLRRLAERSIPTFWTGVHGDVVLEVEGETLTVSTQRDAPSEPLRLREATGVDPGTAGTVERRVRIALDGMPLETTTGTETATDGGSSSESLAIATINADAAGDDRENLEDEYVVFENRGDEPMDLSGWAVEDEADHRYVFPDGFTLDPGASVTLRTGRGTDNATDLYWGSERPIWNNDGDTVVVTDSDGAVVIAREYEG